MQQQPQLRLTPQQAQQLAQELVPLLPGIAATGERFVAELARRAFTRVAAVVRDESGDREYRAPMDL